MTPSQLDLARRLADRPAFKWAPGMLPLRWSTILSAWTACGRLTENSAPPVNGAVPDLDDDATKGVLLGMARKAWNNPGLYASLRPPYREGTTDGPGWRIVLVDGPDALRQVIYATTEGEVLALAILAAS